MNLTLTAQPTATALPTFPVHAPPCRGQDLAGSLHGEGATGQIFLIASYSNVGPVVCYVQGPPNIVFVDSTGQVISMRYATDCFLCEEAKAQEVLHARLGVGVGEQVGVFMIWRNWCLDPVEGVSLRLVLPDALGHHDIPFGALSGAPCQAPEASSSLLISHYSRTP